MHFSPHSEVEKKLAAHMPFEYVFQLALIFTTIPAPQKSDNAQSPRKSYICKLDGFGSAVAVFFSAYEETKKYARTVN